MHAQKTGPKATLEAYESVPRASPLPPDGGGMAGGRAAHLVRDVVPGQLGPGSLQVGAQSVAHGDDPVRHALHASQSCTTSQPSFK